MDGPADEATRLSLRGPTYLPDIVFSFFGRELPPGEYRIRIDALGQVLEEPLSVLPNETTALRLGVEGDRFVLER